MECWSFPDPDGPSFAEADGHFPAGGGLRRLASTASLTTPPPKYARMSTKSTFLVEGDKEEGEPQPPVEGVSAEAEPSKGVVYDKYYHRLGFEIDSDGCSG